MDYLRVLGQLARSWAYLRIAAKGKIVFDWWAPTLAAALMTVPLVLAGEAVNIYGAEGLIRQINVFVQTLPGFFIAALAAVATFNGENLDELLPPPTPTLHDVVRGQRTPIPLTRRRFLCFLFAFLTIQSLLVAILGQGYRSYAYGIFATDGLVAELARGDPWNRQLHVSRPLRGYLIYVNRVAAPALHSWNICGDPCALGLCTFLREGCFVF